MIELQLNHEPADLPEDGLGTSLTYAIKNLREFGGARGDASFTLKLPATARNQRLLGPLAELALDPFARDDPRPDRLIPARLLAGGRLLLEGLAQVLSFSRERFEIQLLGGNANWGRRLKNVWIGDVDRQHPSDDWRVRRWRYKLDVCTYARSLGWQGFADPFLNEDPGDDLELNERWQALAFPFVDYNDGRHLNWDPNVGSFAFDRLRPAAFLWPLLRAHFEAIGFRLNAPFLEQMHRWEGGEGPLALLFTREVWQDFRNEFLNEAGEAEERGFAHLKRATDGSVSKDPQLGISARDATFDTLVDARYPGTFGATSLPATIPGLFRISLPFPRTYRIRWRLVLGSFHADGPSDGLSIQIDWRSTNFSVPPAAFYDKVAPNTVLEGENEITVPGEDQAAFVSARFVMGVDLNSVELLAGSFLAVADLTGQPMAEGRVFDLRDSLPADLTALDLVKGLTAMFNLYWFTDPATREVVAAPREQFFRPGETDFTPAEDTSRPRELRLLSAEHPAFRTFAYEDDTADRLLQALAGDERSYGSGRWINPNETAQGDEQTDVKGLSPTRTERLPNGLFAARLGERQPADLRTDFDPRIVSLQRQFAPDPYRVRYFFVIDFCQGSSFTSTLTEFNTYHAPVFEFAGHSLRFDDSDQAPGLLSRYYAAEFETIRVGRLLDLRVRLDALPLAAFRSFRERGRLAGHRVLPVELSDFRPGESRLADLQLLEGGPDRLPAPTPFRPRGALRLDGTDDFVRTGAALPQLDVGPGDFSFSLWFRAASLADDLALLDTSLNGDTDGLSLYYDALLDDLRLFLWQPPFPANAWIFNRSNNGLIQAQRWHHLALIRERALGPAPRLVIDGQEQPLSIVQAGVPAGAPLQQNGPLAVGAMPRFLGSPNARHLGGLVSQLVVQAKAISTAEAIHRFGNGRGNLPRDVDSLVADLRFEEQEGDTAADRGPLGNAGNLQGYAPEELVSGGGAWVALDRFRLAADA